MYNIENVVSLFDYILNTKRKRHIIGGLLMSLSLLFGGLAITVMTVKNEKSEEDELDNGGMTYGC